MNSSQYRLDMNGAVLDISGTNLNNRPVHGVCIVDPTSHYSAIYINSAFVKQQTSSTLPELSSVSKAWSFLGRSLFSTDPYLNAEIDKFRISDARLSAQQIAANYAAGADPLYQPTAFEWAITFIVRFNPGRFQSFTLTKNQG